MDELKWLKKQLGTNILWFYFALCLAVISSGLFICFPFITREITGMFVGNPTEEEILLILEQLPPLLTILVCTQLLRSVLRYMMLIILENVSQGMLMNVKLYLFKNLLRQDDEFYHVHRTGNLMTCLTGDLDLVRHTVAWLSYNIVESISFFTFASVYFFHINRDLALLLIILTPFILFSSYLYSKSVHPLYAELRERMSYMNSVTQENIAGNKTVRAFVREEYEVEKFAKCNESYREANIVANRHWLKFYPVIEAFSQSLSFITVTFGGIFIIQGKMTIADLTAFTLLTWGISEPMKNLGVYLNDFQRFLASTKKIIAIYNSEPEIYSPEQGKTESSKKGTVEFKNVSMKYSDGQSVVLENISFTLNSGETLGIIGATGSGKTTLIRLITRSVEASEGEILVDGINVRDWDLEKLRSRVSQATQAVGLHSESVRANISYSTPDLSLEKVRQSAQFASAHFIDELPEQYDTIIGEMGMGLSGGQKQRIALARALAKESEILILDDTTSAVDTETERELWENLRNLPYSCSKIIVAQRISAVKEADYILVLEKGKLIQEGTHKTLSEKDGFYKDICDLQGVFAL